MKGTMMAIIGLVVALYIAGSLLPESLTLLTNNAYTGAPAAVKTLATTVAGICAVVAFIMILLNARGK